MNQPLAFIHPDAKIAHNVVVEPFAVINKDVEIGEGTWIGSHAIIMEGARIGKNCRIFPGAVISAVPQDLKFKGEQTVTIIGDNTTIRECVTVNRGTVDKYRTEIGSNCLIMAYTHIAHDCIVGNNVILANCVQLAGHITVGDYANIGGMSAVQQFVKIGKHTYIGGCSQIRKDVPPYIKAAREPLSYAGINSVGLRRRGHSDEKIAEIQDIYRYIYLKGLNNNEAVTQVELEFPATPERDEILNFISNSERGIIKSPLKKALDSEN
ncbi:MULTISPECIES: acyl-ACP--UDP-N-acetylglucosamine O-acyltransferase [Emticicia]|uniref:acyl-ACP--UDP-N-acetylglucosamine O-acyltransferase n=1 Tax=Emticicia TaxID=312278 RepID=UPI000C787A19|nr:MULTISPECIES: acyl-ACP--UDP-N-acetylglucosamine O-acyltransferase [Emticicia]PLK43094.1 acyl-[acyl-carrier-protein]--UDP-N-acetylglucosamine O-acyltransferase [Emticicia sp. TH156]UTA69129.1 acyl-ACP--UDP-N-acetylglucosamine O-acyltransferase [Emticicia sp. 21SJ11W-3]